MMTAPPPRPSRLRFAATAVAISLLLIASYVWLNRESDRSEDLRDAAAASFERRFLAANLMETMADAETAQRGFLLTGNRRYLAPYAPAKTSFTNDAGTILERSPSPALRYGWARFQRIGEAKFAEMNRTILRMEAGRTDEALALVEEDFGRQAMTAMRGIASDLIAEEERILKIRRDAFTEQRSRLRVIVQVFIAVAILLLLASLWLLYRSRVQRHAALVEALGLAERHRAILDSTSDALIILNPSGSIEALNASAARLLDYRPQDLIRRDLGKVLDEGETRSLPFLQRMGVKDGRLEKPLLVDRTARRSDGSPVPVDVALGVMDLPDGLHLVLSLRDVTERRKAEQAKDEFIATVSHELRTPLTSIVGSLGLLAAHDAVRNPESSRQLIAIAHSNAKRLIRLINDILDIDRIEQGYLAMAHEPVDVSEVAREAALGIQPLAELEEVVVETHDLADTAIVMGDAGRLGQVVTNLLSNAVRAAPKGSTVAVAIAVERTDREIRLTVEDRGRGIPHYLRPRLFGRFERGEGEDGGVGAGLGLAISREIVKRHDGHIGFEDRRGGGTRFEVILPARDADDHRAGPRRRVLLVTADDTLIGSVRDLSHSMAFELDRADGLEAAIDRINSGRFDAAIVGLAAGYNAKGSGPDERLDGFAIADAIHRRAETRGLPVIFVAAAPASGAIPNVAFDIVDWVAPSIEVERLREALVDALALERRPSQAAVKPAERPLVLHLDDDADLRELVARSVQQDVRIAAVASLSEARSLLQKETPRAAILDLHLEHGSGLDLLPDLVDAEGAAIPTIVYSAYEAGPDAIQGIDTVLVKAQDTLPDLTRTLRSVLERRGGAR